MKRKIAIYGAFDRYNYGDLLFPLILEYYIKKYLSPEQKKINIEYYGLIESNLEKYGGKKTKPINEILKSGLSDYAIIIAGGEVLGASWTQMLLYLDKSNGLEIILKLLRKISNGIISDYLAKKIVGVNSLYPWMLSKKSIASKKNDIKIIYNTVGGLRRKSVLNMSLDKIGKIKKLLLDADYISVRDFSSKQGVERIVGSEKDIFLIPDSAIALSKIFTRDQLDLQVKKDLIEGIKTFNKRYIIFQMNNYLGKGSEKLIVNQLENIYNDLKLPVVFLAIGRAKGHDDQVFLKKLKSKISTPSFFPDETSIYDIMYLIANSTAYIGTSLHGAITAFSYGVPFTGLTNKVDKLHDFIRTWAIPETPSTTDLDEIYQNVSFIISMDRNKICSRRDELIRMVEENMVRIIDIIVQE